MTRAAVAVPVYSERLTPDEQISARHLLRHLGGHDIVAFSPRRVEPPFPVTRVERFSRRFFRDPVAYSRLLLSSGFYERFESYEYLLLYQLDALVLRDELADWCACPLDYVGAPWLPGPEARFVDEPTVGNGGFSLRRVETFLAVLRAPGVERTARRWLAGKSKSAFEAHEDLFWSFEARKHAPPFRIASVEEALRFSFEVEPRRAFELAGRQLPFGCHAWARYDRAFWEPHLLQ